VGVGRVPCASPKHRAAPPTVSRMTGREPLTAGQRALLRFLQREGRLAAEDLQRLEHLARQENASVQELLEREGLIGEKELAVTLADGLRLRLIDLASFPLEPQVAQTLKESIATKYEVIPLRLPEDGVIDVVMANPLDQEALKAVEFNTGRRVRPAVATRLEVRDALAHAYRLQESLEQFLKHVAAQESLTLTELQDDGGDLRTLAQDTELPPVVKLVDLLLIEGIKGRASDVHVEPASDAVQVRYRIDGILEEAFRFPKWVQSALLGRLKVMAKLDIAERRLPQDGRVQVRYQERVVDLRVSSLPTQHGEKIMLRVLDPSRAVHALDRIGLAPAALARLREAGRRPQGMILVTGPTGSGKSTTLYALVGEIHRQAINIVTIENPIEYQLKGVNQVEINEKQGLTFAGVLRSVLRQDPDVILVGEIRDRETALIACQAAQTGHLVLSTVHTNDVPATVTRMVDIGVEPWVLASSLRLVVAQRLVRRVCTACAAPDAPPAEALRLLGLDPGRVALQRGAGCPACRQTGYAGRIGLYEVVPITPALAALIEGAAGEGAVRQQAREEGCPTLLDDALEKLAGGLTTVEEVLRVVEVGEAASRCPACRAEIEAGYAACPRCGTLLRPRCRACGKPLRAAWTTCPFCTEAVGAPPARTGAARRAERARGPARPRRSFRALAVDDDPDARRILQLTLEGAGLGLAVTAAGGGEEALALAGAAPPDVVILDLAMPGLDGFETCRRLRADLRTAFVPILMLTADATADSEVRGFLAGTDDYLTKPFRREQLLARVRRLIERTYGDESTRQRPGQETSA
jgi:type IV pilus assembly protein PilB